MRIVMGIIVVLAVGMGAFWGGYAINSPKPLSPHIPQPYWEIRSIDTMKSSRDLAKEKLTDRTFDAVITSQVEQIAKTGASHIGLGTPYDPEFIPYLTRWVAIARKNGLKIWFRGNMAGWEQWFGYPKMTEQAHTDGVVNFIKNNADLFQTGDIFSSCPECENGVLGDPRSNGQLDAYRAFLSREHQAVTAAFAAIGKEVDDRYYSMNYDVAKLVMDPETTKALGGVVTIDHYVADPLQISHDIDEIASRSGGKVFLGEWGAPIPDIHGEMSDAEQSQWIEKMLIGIKDNRHVVGLNYWTARGGTTALWHDDGQAKSAISILSNYYQYRE